MMVNKELNQCSSVGLSLQEIQNESLKILQDVHEFCLAHDINYSLAYGTLIGAVRHEGFIPWDDDIDIMMLRSDYDKFCSKYQNDRYKLICFENDPSCLVAYARVCDMESTEVLNYSWTSQKTGIWIDIFPIDFVNDDLSIFNAKYYKARRLWKKSMRHREIKMGPSSRYSPRMNIMIKVMNLFHLGWINVHMARRRISQLIELAKSEDEDRTLHLAQLACCDDVNRNYYSKEDFDSYCSLLFEKNYYKVIGGYESVLSCEYGDYLTLPPEEQRKPKQSSLSFCWRSSKFVEKENERTNS